MVLKSNQRTKEALAKKEKALRRTSTLQKLTDNYFYKAFAQEETEQIREESDEESQGDLEDQYRPSRGKESLTKSNRSSRSRSATARILPNRNSNQLLNQNEETPTPAEDPYNPSFSGMN